MGGIVLSIGSLCEPVGTPTSALNGRFRGLDVPPVNLWVHLQLWWGVRPLLRCTSGEPVGAHRSDQIIAFVLMCTESEPVGTGSLFMTYI